MLKNIFIKEKLQNGKPYFKSKKTQEIFPTKDLFLNYGSMSSYDKYSIVYQNNTEDNSKKYGLVDSDFKMIIPLEYDKITKAGSFNNKFFLHQGDKMGMTDGEANIILEPQFDEISQITSFYKKSGVLLTRNENNYQIFSFGGVPLDNEIYTNKTQEKNFIVVKPIVLSNEKTKIAIDAKARIDRNPK